MRSVITQLSASWLRRALSSTSNVVLAQELGIHPATVSKWRRRLDIPRPTPAQRRVLALLAEQGPWVSWSAVRLPGLTRQATYELLWKLARQGVIQRRGEPKHYEYALVQPQRKAG